MDFELDPLLDQIAASGLFSDGEPILVAVSGGVDSMVLLAALHRLAPVRHWRLTVAHFNHQLRGKESDADEELVRRTVKGLHLRLIVGRASVQNEARRRSWSLEMAARRLRHQFLARAAKQARTQTIALAHHRDDQVELFFLRLLRGAGGEGLAGMKHRNPSPADKKLILTRPLLNCSKAEVRAFAAANRLSFSEDATNASLEIMRNRIRHTLLPLLRSEFQPALDTTVLRSMELISAESDFARTVAEEWLKTRQTNWDALPLAVQRRALQMQLYDLGIPPDFNLIERLRQNPDAPTTTSTGMSVLRNASGSVHIQSKPSLKFLKGEKTIRFDVPAGSTSFGGLKIAWKLAGVSGAKLSPALNAEQFDADNVGNSIILRHWRPGDRYQPIGAASARKLQDVFTDLKAPTEERRRRVIATTAAGEIFWVQGLRISEKCKLGALSRRRLVWRWRKT